VRESDERENASDNISSNCKHVVPRGLKATHWNVNDTRYRMFSTQGAIISAFKLLQTSLQCNEGWDAVVPKSREDDDLSNVHIILEKRP
jgi:hypothetical protein